MKTLRKRVLSVFLALAMMIVLVPPNLLTVDASILPLEEKEACLVYTDFNSEYPDITNIPLRVILDNLVDNDGNSIEIDENAKVVWTYYKNSENKVIKDEYHIIEKDDKVDLSAFDTTDQYKMELIIGDGEQLNPANKRYLVKVFTSESDTINVVTGFRFYKQNDDGTRYEPTITNTQVGSALGFNMRRYIIPGHTVGTEYYLNIISTAVEHPYVKAKVERLDMNTNQYVDITDRVLNQDMTISNAGYKSTFDFDLSNILQAVNSSFFITYYDTRDGHAFHQSNYIINVNDGTDVPKTSAELHSAVNGNYAQNIVAREFGDTVTESGVFMLSDVFMLEDNYSASDEYYYAIDMDYPSFWDDDANKHIVKAVVGIYTSIDDAIDQEDIKEQLIPAKDNRNNSPIGYKTVYKVPIYFTVFFDNNVYFNIKAQVIDYDPSKDSRYLMEQFTSLPIIGAKDPWVRVTGAIDNKGNKLDSYVIENGKAINMDTYYGYGYQTVFVKNDNDDIDLTNVKPIFWRADTDRVADFYEVSKNSSVSIGDINNHTRDFSDVNKQYTVKIDGNEKNYWVTYKKLNNNGPELYVFGPSSREILLNEYFENKHDILIANVGNAPLTNIRVELDATNVKLDDYWTVGGDGNNTLAKFDTTTTDKQYGELPNLAKIRLVKPSAEEITGDGTISGTLTISADGQEPVVITLNGNVQQPEIVNDDIPYGVKYVPYSSIIATSNFHDWIDTEFSIVDGEFPEWADEELFKKTGEIYGVPNPEESEDYTDYTFTVAVDYIVDGNSITNPENENYQFHKSVHEYTLRIVGNTNEEVYKTTTEDDVQKQGYPIKTPLGTDEDGDHGYIVDLDNDVLEFVSEGDYDEFKYTDETGKEVNKVWLNGVLLEEGVEGDEKDYISEPGSTRITLTRQALEGKTQDGRNTIAIEFRNDKNELRRTAENFEIKVKKPDTKPDDSSSKPDDTSKPDDSSSKPDDTSKPDDNASKPDDSSKPIDRTDSDTNDADTDTVTMVVLLTDNSGSPLNNYTIELHSKVQIKKTNADGYVRFSGAEIGSHTFTIIDAAGVTKATKSFEIVDGKSLKLDGNTITAAGGSTFTLTLKLNGSNLTLVSVQSGDKSGIKSNDDSSDDKSKSSDGSSSGDNNSSFNGDRKANGDSNTNDDTTQSPETGNTGHLSLLFIAISMTGMLAFKKKRN